MADDLENFEPGAAWFETGYLQLTAEPANEARDPMEIRLRPRSAPQREFLDYLEGRGGLSSNDASRVFTAAMRRAYALQADQGRVADDAEERQLLRFVWRRYRREIEAVIDGARDIGDAA